MNKNLYLRTLLKQKNISIPKLANEMEITPATLNKKINGDIRFSEDNIKILLEVLNMTYEEVFNSKKVVISINDNVFFVSKDIAYKINTLIKKEVG